MPAPNRIANHKTQKSPRPLVPCGFGLFVRDAIVSKTV